VGLADAPMWSTARRHQVDDEDIRHALRNWVAVNDEDDDVTLFLGPDHAGNLIEVGVLDTDDGPAIIHALRPARPFKFEAE
jgi:hypothetical protein